MRLLCREVEHYDRLKASCDKHSGLRLAVRSCLRLSPVGRTERRWRTGEVWGIKGRDYA